MADYDDISASESGGFSGYDDLAVDEFEDGPVAANPRDVLQVDWSKLEEVEIEDQLSTSAVRLLHPLKLQRFVSELVDEWDRTNAEQMRETRLNRDYLSGDGERHWQNTASPHEEPPWTQHYSPNMARVRALQHKALVMAKQTIATFEASSSDVTDEMVTEAAEAFAAYQDSHFPQRSLRSRAMDCALIGGIAVGELKWNPSAGRIIEYDPEGNPVYEGMVEPEIHPFWRACVDVNAERHDGRDGLRRANNIVKRYEVTRDELETMLTDDELSRVRRAGRMARKTDSESTNGERHRLEDPTAKHDIWGEDPRETSERYELWEFHRRRSKNFPLGLWGKFVNGRIVNAGSGIYGDWSEDGDLDLHFVVFNPYRTEGRFAGVPLMSLLRGPQDAIRKVESRNLERFIIGADKIILQGCGEIDGEWNDLDGQMVSFDTPAGNVHHLKGNRPGPHDYTVSDRAMAHMDQITAAYPTARGEGGDANTAREAALLREAADIAANEVGDELNLFMEAMRMKEMKLIQKAYDYARQMDIKGPEGAPMVRAFSGASLEGLTDYKLTSDSMLPAGRASRIAALSALGELGQVLGTPIVTAQKAQELLGMDAGITSDEKRMRERAAVAAMSILEFGQPLRVHPRERHDVFIEVFEKILHSSLYSNAPIELQMMFDMQLEERHNYVMAAMLQAVAMQQPPGEGDGNNGREGVPLQAESLESPT